MGDEREYELADALYPYASFDVINANDRHWPFLAEVGGEHRTSATALCGVGTPVLS